VFEGGTAHLKVRAVSSLAQQPSQTDPLSLSIPRRSTPDATRSLHVCVGSTQGYPNTGRSCALNAWPNCQSCTVPEVSWDQSGFSDRRGAAGSAPAAREPARSSPWSTVPLPDRDLRPARPSAQPRPRRARTREAMTRTPWWARDFVRWSA
jgi:hypothetical protein